MRALVTGAGGFVGSEVARALVLQGHEVHALVRLPAASPRPSRLAPGVRLHTADLDDEAAVRRVLADARPEVVFHLAWYAHPTDYLTSPENQRSLATTVAFADLVFGSGCRKLVGVGSCLEYADLPRPRREEDATEPRSPYAACKLAALVATQELAQRCGGELAWARLFHPHGPREAPARLIPWVVSELRRGEAVELTDGSQIRDHLHVADAAAGIAALGHPGTQGVVNVCSGTPVTLRRVIEIVAALVGRPELLRFGTRPHRPGEVMFLAGDPSRLRGTGWHPRFTLEAGLRDAVLGGG